MANNDETVDVTRKRRPANIASTNANPINKRLRSYNNGSFLHLNDDCLLGIFEHLTRIDLCHVKNVCDRFAPLAETAFRLNLRNKRCWANYKMERTNSDTRHVFYNFGHLFKSFQVYSKIDSDILERLTQMTSLILVNSEIDWKMTRAIYSAEHLKILDMVSCKFVGDFGHNTPGNSCNIVHNTSENSSQSLHNKDASLVRFILQQTLPPLHTFKNILQRNQQLRCIGIPIDIPEEYISNILIHAQQLSELVIFTNGSDSRRIYQLVSRLRPPKLLAFNGNVSLERVSPLLQGIKQTTSDVSLLILSDFFVDEQAIELISQMKNLRHVVLKGKFACLVTEMVSLVASLPLLNNFSISFKSCSTRYQNVDFTFDHLKHMVKVGRELDFLKILYARSIRINGEDYAELVDLLQKYNRKLKLSIKIQGCKLSTSFDVPMHVRRADLKVEYFKNVACICKE